MGEQTHVRVLGYFVYQEATYCEQRRKTSQPKFQSKKADKTQPITLHAGKV